MGIVFVLLYFLALPAGLAAGLAAALGSFLPKASLRRRTLIAAATAGFLPMIIPIAAILLEGAEPIALIAVLAMGLVLCVAIGLPMALYIGRRNGPPPPSGQVFD